MSTYPALRVVTRTVAPGVLVAAVGGELDYDTGGTFLALLSDALDSYVQEHGTSPSDLHLDCTDLTLIDSVGLSSLLMLRRRTQRARTTLHLDNRSAQLTRLLDLTGTTAYLTEPPTARRPADGWEADEPDAVSAP
ncbi:STAS domain-containing protein [Streptomyces sp. YS415]|uniref:STAS domain-containing protein n=1 Tax=Streptomyces sp. YS415 TaxID=2944806 RepID=UPI00201FDF61|nr:STAS domain-containing protein [Streptomyces sp. YS415]MCL7428004.1 STAS domain-containing protein [Streptomyces sp. YS415]